MQPRITCYCIVWLDTRQTPPTVDGIGIYSDRLPSSISIARVPTILAQYSGDDYETARAKVVEILKTYFPWALAMYEAQKS